MLHFYDFEVYKKLWTAVFINPQRREITKIVNDPVRLLDYYNTYKNEIFVGYNNRHYDQWIFKSILCGFDPKEVNDFIILKQRKGWEFSDLLTKNYPMNNFDVFSKTDGGLKTLEAYMGDDIRETSIPFDYEGEFTPEMIEEVLSYNTNDVVKTMDVFKLRKNEFDAQWSLIQTFNLPFSYIGKTQAQLAAEILGAVKTDYNDEWDIFLPHTLKLSKYQYIADWFLNEMSEDNSSLETMIAGIPHVVADGGTHAAEEQYIYTCGPDEVILSADVDQLYPSIMKCYGLLSRSVHDPEKFKVILETSLRLKAEKKKKEREPYKRICNIAYGAMGDKYNKLYDPRNRRLVCVFGQLLMVDLIEKIESMCQLVQSNTDGIFVKVKRADIPRLKAAIKEWEDRTMLKMSFDEYKSIYQKDVNNYLTVEYNGQYKCKGAYIKNLNPLDYDLPIVNKAIKEYMLHGTDPRQTIMECDDLREFQKVVKVSSKYLCAIKNATFRIEDGGVRVWNRDGERLTDKTFRVFASTRPKDLGIHKLKTEDARNPDKFANTPEKCFIFNKSVKGVELPPYLDKSWYVDLAVKRLQDYGVMS